MRPGTDVWLPYYRDLGVVLTAGMTPYEVFLGVFAKADDPSSGGRQMPAHWGSRRLGIISGSSPIATQVPHAAGIACAARYRGEDTVVGCWFGDGATSEGDWHEGLNFSGIHRLPVIFVCENNQYAISVPQSKQMAVKDVASRAEGYGFPGVVVDGNDVLACYGAMKRAHERARAGEGPTLIECKTYRFMPHTSDDDDKSLPDTRGGRAGAGAAIRWSSSARTSVRTNSSTIAKDETLRAEIEGGDRGSDQGRMGCTRPGPRHGAPARVPGGTGVTEKNVVTAIRDALHDEMDERRAHRPAR